MDITEILPELHSPSCLKYHTSILSIDLRSGNILTEYENE